MLLKTRIFSMFLIIVVNHLIGYFLPTFSGEGQYVPTIANGLMTALALLISISTFISVLAFQRLDKKSKKDLLDTLENCFELNLIILMILTIIGYRLIAIGDFSLGYYVFTDLFIVAITANFLLWIHARGALAVSLIDERP